jgi:hypothetical protein
VAMEKVLVNAADITHVQAISKTYVTFKAHLHSRQKRLIASSCLFVCLHVSPRFRLEELP